MTFIEFYRHDCSSFGYICYLCTTDKWNLGVAFNVYKIILMVRKPFTLSGQRENNVEMYLTRAACKCACIERYFGRTQKLKDSSGGAIIHWFISWLHKSQDIWAADNVIHVEYYYRVILYNHTSRSHDHQYEFLQSRRSENWARWWEIYIHSSYFVHRKLCFLKTKSCWNLLSMI